MSNKTKTYIGFSLIFAAAFAGSIFAARNSPFLQQLFALPMVAALGGALFKFFRDVAAHERAIALQVDQQHFAIGASSHMADVAFDKHILFSEKYVAEAQASIHTLFRDGATEEALQCARRLFQIREDYIVWLTPALEKELDVFERALRELGAAAGLVKSTRESPEHQDVRQKTIPEMYKMLAQVLGLPQWEGKAITDELAVAAVIRKLRSLLGTEELTELRQAIINRASSALKTRPS
ncbi:MAG: hypothetical protein JWR07_5118 [Nevskia sp.]|nr:hypothetical protein [Nevskia sp.]